MPPAQVITAACACSRTQSSSSRGKQRGKKQRLTVRISRGSASSSLGAVIVVTGSCRTSSLCPSYPKHAPLCAGLLRRCCLAEFWGEDRTKTGGWGHDTASNPARTYNDCVGMSDSFRPTFPDHRCALQNSQKMVSCGIFQCTSMVWKSGAK